MQADAMFPNLMSIAPEILLALGAMVTLMFAAFREDRSSVSITAGLSMALVIAAGVLVWLVPADPEPIFGGSFQLDTFAKFMKTLVAIGSATAILLSIDYMRYGQLTRFEYPVLIVLATAGMFVMVSATDLISLYLGLELQSLAAYVVAAIQRDSVRSTEAGLKYFVLGALASGMLLYGASLIYGFCGRWQRKQLGSLQRQTRRPRWPARCRSRTDRGRSSATSARRPPDRSPGR
jgi:NADH-quinone oxidoreductase subunit N